LHKELEALVHKRDKDKKELIERAEDFEQMAMKRYIYISDQSSILYIYYDAYMCICIHRSYMCVYSDLLLIILFTIYTYIYI
jgi:hypothetical protein